MESTSSDQSAATSGQDAPNAVATAPITVEQAAAVLGVSVTTVKRRIRAGSLRGEQAQRPQGMVWLVYLDPAATPSAEERPPAASVAATAPTTLTAQADAMVSLIQTTIATVLGPLVGQIDAQRQTIERQADRIAELERENGMLSERLTAPAPAHSPVASNLRPEPVTPPSEPATPRSWWSARWAFVLAAIVLLAVAGLWLLLPR